MGLAGPGRLPLINPVRRPEPFDHPDHLLSIGPNFAKVWHVQCLTQFEGTAARAR